MWHIVLDKHFVVCHDWNIMERKTKNLKDQYITFRGPAKLLVLLDDEAEQEGLSRSDVIRRIVLNHFRGTNQALEKVS